MTDPQGRLLAARLLLILDDEDGGEMFEVEPSAKGIFHVPEDVDLDECAALASPVTTGHWTTYRDKGAIGDAIVCRPLPAPPAHSWWHTLLGAYAADPQRGAGIRVGVIDSAFRHNDGLEAVKHVSLDGRAAIHAGSHWAHGEAVCRILGDRGAPPSCAAIAPGADLVFANASFSPSTLRHPMFQMPVNGSEDHLDIARIQDAIYRMVLRHEVNLINLSLGTFADLPASDQDGLTHAIQLARSSGVAVICAAGNMPYQQAGFPAHLDECVGVGAYGASDWGPRGSFAQWLASRAEEHGTVQERLIYYSPESAYGNGIDTIAPGVGLLIARHGLPAFDLTGTSFAAPIVTGLLAVALAGDPTYLSMPSDERRTVYAEQRLRDLCIPTMIDEEWEGGGAIQLLNHYFEVDG